MDVSAGRRSAIFAVRPDLADLPMIVHTRGWDCDAVEAGDTIFKFPKRPDAVERLRLEARVLALVRPRVPLAIPNMQVHEAPLLFSEHRKIPGTIIETYGYNVLDDTQKAAMANRLAAFYASLHAIPVADALAIGVGLKPEWPSAEAVLPRLGERLPKSMHRYARRVFEAYEDLPDEDAVFGYFDGHGWNMAFDHERGVLNGLYDFADAGIGPRGREFTYSNLTSGDLTLRIITDYRRMTGIPVDPRAVAVRTAVQTLAELAEADDDIRLFVAAVARWHDYIQSRPDLIV